MSNVGNKKKLNMLILEILEKYSDSDHRLTQQEILRILAEEYETGCDRRSVKSNVLSLIEMGYVIDMESGYYLKERRFSEEELSMLIDCVSHADKFGEGRKTKLITKLKTYGNKYFDPRVPDITNIQKPPHFNEDNITKALRIISDAIAAGKQIVFTYNDYGSDLKLHPRRIEEYVVNPYRIVLSFGRFFLVGNYDSRDNITYYRIDRMSAVEMIDENLKPYSSLSDAKNGIEIPRNMTEQVYMLGGERVDAKIAIDSRIISDVVDCFGDEFEVLEEDETGMIINVKCNENALLYWALQYGAAAEVLSPESLRDNLRRCVTTMNERYSREIESGQVQKPEKKKEEGTDKRRSGWMWFW